VPELLQQADEAVGPVDLFDEGVVVEAVGIEGRFGQPRRVFSTVSSARTTRGLAEGTWDLGWCG